jgi:hypothetical protein
MVRIGTVWDLTVDVLQGRAGILAGLAALYLFVPDMVSRALTAFGGTGAGMALLGLVVVAAVVLLLVMGILALTAVASDPAVGRAAAVRIALARLPAALGVVLTMVGVALVAFVPLALLLWRAGVAVDRVSGRMDMTNADGGSMGIALLLSLVLLVVGLWLSARLVPLLAVVVNERRGVGAFRRSFALTRGAGGRLMGVILLYAVVLLVVMAAVTSVTGIVARLLLGGEADGAVTFVTGSASAIVTAAATVLQAVFYTQFYVAAHAAEGAASPRPA